MSPPPAGSPSPTPPPAGPPDRRRGPKSRTASRSELARHARFAEISPEVGALDEAALHAALDQDPDAALAMLADLASATDEGLRAAARRLAARLLLDRARSGSARRRGVGRLRAVSADSGGDLDLDASMDAVVAARAQGRAPVLEDLVARDWSRPELALVLVVDRSGSMGGERLATAALTAAACAVRAPDDFAVLAFAAQVEVLRPMGATRPASAVVDTVLGLRGHGTTSLAAALRAGTDQLSTARASRRVLVLLSDCRSTEPDDSAAAAAHVPELLVLSPAADSDQAQLLAHAAGARWAPLAGPADAPGALARLLD